MCNIYLMIPDFSLNHFSMVIYRLESSLSQIAYIPNMSHVFWFFPGGIRSHSEVKPGESVNLISRVIVFAEDYSLVDGRECPGMPQCTRVLTHNPMMVG